MTLLCSLDSCFHFCRQKKTNKKKTNRWRHNTNLFCLWEMSIIVQYIIINLDNLKNRFWYGPLFHIYRWHGTCGRIIRYIRSTVLLWNCRLSHSRNLLYVATHKGHSFPTHLHCLDSLARTSNWVTKLSTGKRLDTGAMWNRRTTKKSS